MLAINPLIGLATRAKLENRLPLELIAFISRVVESASCAFVSLIFNVYWNWRSYLDDSCQEWVGGGMGERVRGAKSGATEQLGTNLDTFREVGDECLFSIS